MSPTLNAVGQRAEDLRLDRLARAAREPVGVARRPALGADLSGWIRIRRHPASQGDARTTSPRSRHRARPGAGDGDAGLGPARGRQGADQRHPGPGTAAEVALNGVREEARVGQRTTLDVLNAQQDLVNARVALVTAQRDRVVASYTVLAATGALSPQVLGLKIKVYDPVPHYYQVRDAWGGVRTPEGR